MEKLKDDVALEKAAIEITAIIEEYLEGLPEPERTERIKEARKAVDKILNKPN